MEPTPPEPQPYPARIEHQPDEPSYGLLLRTAEHNGAIRPYSVVRRFCGHGRNPTAIDVAEIAFVCKANEVDLRHATPVLTPSTVSVLGQVLDRRQFSCLTRRWCPHCLQESPHHRVWWDLMPITTCPFHGVELVSRCECDAPLRTIYHFIGHCRHGHDLASVETVPADHGALAVDGYLVRRLLGHPSVGIDLFDRTSLDHLIDLLENTGRALLPGTRLNQSRQGGSRRHILAAGFETLSDIDGRFRKMLDEISSVDHAVGRKWGLEKTYGRFYMELVHRPDSALRSAMLDAISRHAATRTSLKGGQVMGRDVHTQDSYTAHEASKLLGLGFERFRRLAVSLDLMPKEWGQGTPFRIARSKIEELAERLAGHKDLKTIALELGISDPTAARIARDGFLDSIVEGGFNQRDMNKWIIHRDAASHLLRRLDEHLPAVMEVGEHLAPLPKAAQVAWSNASKMISLILEGTMAIRGVDPAATGLLRYLLSKSEVRIALRRERAPGVTQNEAIARTGYRGGVFQSWLRGGIIAHKTVGRITTISEHELERFMREYATVPALSALTGLRWKDVRFKLTEAGVPPVADRPEFVQVLYERGPALKVLTPG